MTCKSHSQQDASLLKALYKNRKSFLHSPFPLFAVPAPLIFTLYSQTFNHSCNIVDNTHVFISSLTDMKNLSSSALL